MQRQGLAREGETLSVRVLMRGSRHDAKAKSFGFTFQWDRVALDGKRERVRKIRANPTPSKLSALPAAVAAWLVRLCCVAAAALLRVLPSLFRALPSAAVGNSGRYTVCVKAFDARGV